MWIGFIATVGLLSLGIWLFVIRNSSWSCKVGIHDWWPMVTRPDAGFLCIRCWSVDEGGWEARWQKTWSEGGSLTDSDERQPNA